MEIRTNEYQTQITDDLLLQYPKEVREQFLDIISTVPFIQNLISSDRPRIEDLPRDSKGRAIVDLTNPPIYKNADYFRQAALYFLKEGTYTKLKPNSNPNSNYRKFWDREIERCYDGLLRESDGMWISGYLYWFLNYCPMMINIYKKGFRKAVRKKGFGSFFEGIWWRFLYLDKARENGHHAAELAKRGCGKSISLSAIMSRNLIFGESRESSRGCVTILTAYQKEYLKDDKDGTLNKFIPELTHLSNNTPFPRLMLKQSSNEMTWQMGYKDEYGKKQGSLNQVIGVSAKDDSDKLRGKRGWILYEEFGNFNGLLELYDVTRKSTEDGDFTFATQYLVGTSNNKESNFQSAKTLLYAPKSYNIQEIPNVYDKKGQGRENFSFFFPAYINRAGCYNEDGISDVVAALLQILYNRHQVKYGADPTSVLRTIAEDPITPAEAIIKVKEAYFNVQALSERAFQLDTNPSLYNDVYVGTLFLNKNGNVEFKPTDDIPIRTYPIDNDTRGALEIYHMPEKNKEGDVFNERYIIGVDPVDNDVADSSSLYSCFVFDLFMDTIAAEFTGRNPYADDNFEITRLMALFYNARCLYEAHPYDQTVRLPDGKTKQWGDIKIGDTLLAPNGTTVKVTDIPVDGEDDIYRITLDDGRKVEASSNHIWKVKRINHREYEELHTIDMYKEGCLNEYRQHNFFIPESGAIDYPHRDVPVDPYAMGLLIAEGTFIQFKADKYQNSDKRIIQNLYLFNDYNTRLELLKGLMDGNGCVTETGDGLYITASRQLSEDIKLLCRSLGIKAKNNKEVKACTIKNENKKYQCSKSYKVVIMSGIPIFKLPRKVSRQHIYSSDAKGNKADSFLYDNAIVNIEYIGRKKCKCITVDNPNGLYLIGDYVVTHNCNKKGLFAYFNTKRNTFLLAETPKYLRDKQMIKYSSFGSNAYGVNASAAINNYANALLKDWFNKPVTVVQKDNDGNEKEVEIPILYTLKNRALIEEAIKFNPEINVDRIRAMGMVMLYRESFIIKYGNNISNRSVEFDNKEDLSNDPFFTKNYDKRFKQ